MDDTVADDDFTTRRDRALRELAETPLSELRRRPPLHRVLWSLGARVRPPHYASFASLAALLAALFGVLFVLLTVPLLTLLGARWTDDFVTTMAWAYLAVAIAYGVIVAGVYRRDAKLLGLTPWDELA